MSRSASSNTQPFYHAVQISFVEGRKPVDLEKLRAAFEKAVRTCNGHEPDVDFLEAEAGDPTDLDKW